MKWAACKTELGVRRGWGGSEPGGSGGEGELTQVSEAVTLEESVCIDLLSPGMSAGSTELNQVNSCL